MAIQIAPTVLRLLTWQASAGVLLAAALLAVGFEAAYSALAGASIGFLANVFFALRVFDTARRRDARSTLSALYLGATGKFVVTAALFCVAFLLISPLHAPALFAGFIAMHVVNWVVLTQG